MNIGSLKNELPFKPRANASLHIITYGVNNDIPQNIQKIIYASPTACDCMNIFHGFLYRGGFKEPTMNDVIVNSQNETLLSLLEKITKDYAMFGSFAIHIVENELHYVPFEYVRMGIPDENYQVNYYAIFDDWTGEKVNILFQHSVMVTDEIITYVHAFVPSAVERLQQARSLGFIGQLYYYNPNTMTQYPLPIHYPALTDMSTEAGLCNLSYRNARMNFFPAGMITMVDTESKNAREMESRKEEISQRIRDFQGDCNAGKLLYVPVDDPANVPQFIQFQTQNLDALFTNTTEAVQNRIGRVFNQPPILRGEDVGSNFGADAIANAYQFYNSICDAHRQKIAKALNEINEVVRITNGQIEIAATEYLNKDDIKKFDNEEILTIQQILADESMGPKAKKKMLVMAFGLEESDADELTEEIEEREQQQAEQEATQNEQAAAQQPVEDEQNQQRFEQEMAHSQADLDMKKAQTEQIGKDSKEEPAKKDDKDDEKKKKKESSK